MFQGFFYTMLPENSVGAKVKGGTRNIRKFYLATKWQSTNTV